MKTQCGNDQTRRSSLPLLRLTILLAVTALLSGCGLLAPSAAQDGQNVLNGITSWSAPDGFRQDVALSAAGVSTVVYNHSDGNSHIYLMQAPKWLDISAEEMVATVRGNAAVDEALAEDAGENVQFLGESQAVQVAEGINSDGEPFRSAVLITEVNGQLTVIMYERPVDAYDAEEMAAFFASIE